MPLITRELLRKRAEHNEGMITTLEEISLHQEELESINEVLGMTCRKLKILYLQNNIIPKMENLFHLKDLEYLNLALNNISKIEGLHNCEFLKKLDLTVNFIDFDSLKESIDGLEGRLNLRELYLMGNPVQVNWERLNEYVIARLPQLTTLDGTSITKSMKIKALQQLPVLEKELEERAKICRKEKAEKEMDKLEKMMNSANEIETVNDENEMTDNTPEARVEIYKELAQQKKEKEEKENQNRPKQRDYEKEQKEAIESTRAKEQETDEKEIKQKNEGGWDFFWDEETRPGYVQLDVRVPRFLDSSLIDVDIHPSYLSVIIKSKVLRLRLPAEVRVSDSKCQRSKTTGSLVLIMPKVNPKENAVTIRGDLKAKQESTPRAGTGSTGKGTNNKGGAGTKPKKLSLQEQMIQDALQQQEAVKTASNSLKDSDLKSSGSGLHELRNIVQKPKKSEGSRVDLARESETVFRSSRVVELD